MAGGRTLILWPVWLSRLQGTRESPQAKEHRFWGLDVRPLDPKLVRPEGATGIDHGELKHACS